MTFRRREREAPTGRELAQDPLELELLPQRLQRQEAADALAGRHRQRLQIHHRVLRALGLA
jgi:hypothetical protein